MTKHLNYLQGMIDDTNASQLSLTRGEVAALEWALKLHAAAVRAFSVSMDPNVALILKEVLSNES